jgi:flagellar biosynthesis/type III secretory pathway chaperone
MKANLQSTPDFLPALVRDLREHLGLCESALALAAEENQALNQAADFQPLQFQPRRQSLLAVLDGSVTRLRTWRQVWQQFSPADRERCTEVKPLFQKISDLLMRVLQLDRENQQALLRRGLVPPQHLSLAASPPAPHYVLNLYRRHAGTG